ncbi:hypothetical protein N658DRAFT_11666 [Parathielavia hyrcaniae]|uniref:Uncharacterized protein n=1 Tax=Parathielavia hyrcaniae TaxID=113614 RepID=A0AAN6Q9N9_9PEZI|nr:hypothetical protein N658DRAFT_11666 [Parathielavia hyrcaniae]
MGGWMDMDGDGRARGSFLALFLTTTWMTFLLRGRADLPFMFMLRTHAYIPRVLVLMGSLELAGWLRSAKPPDSGVCATVWCGKVWSSSTVKEGEGGLYTAFFPFQSGPAQSCPSMTPPWHDRNMSTTPSSVFQLHSRLKVTTLLATSHDNPQQFNSEIASCA